MSKLELKHIVGYLPYGLKIMRPDNNTILELSGLQGSLLLFLEGTYGQIGNNRNKPILRQLSDLRKEIEVNGEKFVPIEWFEKNINKNISFYMPLNPDMYLQIDIETENYSQTIDLFDGYLVVQKLHEWHFDIHGLIEKGLAIDKNTLL